MRVEFLRDWKWFKKGQVFDLTKGRADHLIKRRLCKLAPLPVKKPKPVASTPVKAEEAPEQPKRRRKSAIPKPQAAD
jgi:hypothetical protein